MSWFYYEEEKNKKISSKCLRICGVGREGRGRGIFLHRSVLFYSKGKKNVTKVSHTGIFPAPDTRLFPVFLSNGWRKHSMSGSYLFSFFQVCFYFVILGRNRDAGVDGGIAAHWNVPSSLLFFLFFIWMFSVRQSQSSRSRPLCQCCILNPPLFLWIFYVLV